MFQNREILSGTLKEGHIKFSDDYATTGLQSVENITPGINNHTVAIGFTAVNMKTALSSSNYITLILNGACTHQGLPVCLAGGRDR